MTMSSPDLPSKLPPELEREIFELAVQSDPLSVLQLMLVAWRVHEWVKPFLYCVILLLGAAVKDVSSYPWESFSRYLSIPPSILQQSVKHLCIRMAPQNVTEYVLSAASGVENLWVATRLEESSEGRLLAALPNVRRLHCSFSLILAAVAVGTTPPVFSRLTHLEIFEQVDPEISDGLALIPNLTHLAMDDADVDAPLLLDFLERCKSLRVLIMLSVSGRPHLDLDDEGMDQLVKDPRFLQMSCREYIADWKIGALTGVDYWSRADDFVARRRAGNIDPLRYFIEDDDVDN
ncbi:hypothetical protein FB45DRAFT_237817 [Roridomyces roridus]|uniref:Uncharacterized protein n=1 Tax=Roridomyces roridus TaxID=1738132 RepID=A0AAD7BBL8_9AGAR|nr:hypothetical protein FB45DRAFT_237817 [Roridomyces roridus]